MLLCACILTWMGWSSSPQEALALCLSRRGLSESVMCPSQLRYLQYFDSLLQNVRPSADALLLNSITIAALPDLENGSCTPYLEVAFVLLSEADLQSKQARLLQSREGQLAHSAQCWSVGHVLAQRRAARKRFPPSSPPHRAANLHHHLPRTVLHRLCEAVQAESRCEGAGSDQRVRWTQRRLRVFAGRILGADRRSV